MSIRERFIQAVALQTAHTGWYCPGGIAHKISARTGVPVADIIHPQSSALEYIRAVNCPGIVRKEVLG